MKRMLYITNRFFVSISIYTLLLLSLSCSSDEIIEPNVTPQEQVEEQNETVDELIAPEDKLPLIQINTLGNQIVDDPKIVVNFIVTEAGSVTFNGFVGIEYRGSTSQMFPKKGYGLETRDANGEDLKVELLGFPEEEDWILHGPYSDKSLVRNMLVYDLSRDIGQYASRTKFVELEINGSYNGVYVFMEKLKRDSNRIDINKLKDDENSGEDLTGGYILKIDKTTGNIDDGLNNANSFQSNHSPLFADGEQKINFQYEYPDADDITAEQRTYISEYVSQFEDALASENFEDATTGYAAYIDVESFIDFFILNEISNNVDGYRLSTFMHKEKNEKLNMGPVWDFNIAFGNVDYCGNDAYDTWAYRFNERCESDNSLVPFWWDRLLEDPAFVAKLQQRWNTLRGGVLSNATVLAKIDAYETTLIKAGAIESNFETWPVFNQYIWPNSFIGKDYDEELGFLTGWLDNRLNWLDGAIEAL